MKGLWYPEVQGRTSGHFHTNRYHHFMSTAAMFGPSPDWFVGISGINLCLPDCSWVEERAFDLLPYDAGTDNGPTYMVSSLLILNSVFYEPRSCFYVLDF